MKTRQTQIIVARVLKNMTQQEVVDLVLRDFPGCGLTLNMYAKIECGIRKGIPMDVAKGICRHLGIDKSELMKGGLKIHE